MLAQSRPELPLSHSAAHCAALLPCEQAAPAPPPPSGLEDALINPIKDVVNEAKDFALDCIAYIMAAPRFAADVTVHIIGLVRGLPSLAKNMYNADGATLDSCASFASTTASTIFALYAALAALNLLLKTICDVKDACTDYLTLPKKVMGQNVSNPVCDTVQKHILDPIKSWRNPVFLDDLVGKPTVSDAATTLAGAMSGCMCVERPPPAPAAALKLACAACTSDLAFAACRILACTPDVLGLITGGANKANAEAVAWTLGTALAVKYLVNKA